MKHSQTTQTRFVTLFTLAVLVNTAHSDDRIILVLH